MCPVEKTRRTHPTPKSESSKDTTVIDLLTEDPISNSDPNGFHRSSTSGLLPNLPQDPAWHTKVLQAVATLSVLADTAQAGSDSYYKEIPRILSQFCEAPQLAGIRLIVEGRTYESTGFSACEQPDVTDVIVTDEAVGRLELHFPDGAVRDADSSEVRALRFLAEFAARELGHHLSSQRMTHTIDTLCRHQLTVLDSISEPIYVVGPKDHVIIWSNETFNKIWGHRVGQKCHNFILDQTAPSGNCSLPVSEPGNGTQVFEFENPATGLWYRNICKTVRWPDGRLVACHVAIDITQRREAEQKLQESEHVLNEAQRMAQTGSWQMDISSKMMKMSTSMMDIHGFDSDVLPTDQVLQFIHPDDRNRVREAFDRALQGDPVSLEYRIVKPDGVTRFMVMPAARLFTNESGQPTKLVGVTRDITNRKNQEAALRTANDRLETEQDLLKEKNIALSQVLNQIEEEKRQIAHQVQANIDRIILPLVRKLYDKLQPAEREYLTMLRTNLEDIASPFVNEMQTRYAQLSPRELEVCNMIRNGQTSKDIAGTYDTSVETVRKQRQSIRRKLGLINSNTNLISFLQKR